MESRLLYSLVEYIYDMLSQSEIKVTDNSEINEGCCFSKPKIWLFRWSNGHEEVLKWKASFPLSSKWEVKILIRNRALVAKHTVSDNVTYLWWYYLWFRISKLSLFFFLQKKEKYFGFWKKNFLSLVEVIVIGLCPKTPVYEHAEEKRLFGFPRGENYRVSWKSLSSNSNT